MKNIVLLLCSIITFLFSTVSEVKAQISSTEVVTATAEVIDALTSKETSQLNFGRFSPEAQGGKVVIKPEGDRTAQGTVVLAGGTFSAASFYITGQNEATFSITLPVGSATLINSNGDKTMLVDEWQSIPAPGTGMGKLVNGWSTVRIGASLIVSGMNNNPKGIYAGTYSVTFAYN